MTAPTTRVTLLREGTKLLICPDGVIPRETLLVPSVVVEGGEVFVDLGITAPPSHERPGTCVGAVLDSPGLPLWLQLVLGPEVLGAARLMQEDGSRSSLDVECAEPVPREGPCPRGLARLAQGMWIRRYWPTSTIAGIPATRTDLIDLEIGALLTEPDVSACRPDDSLTAALLLPRRHLVMDLADGLDRVDPAIHPRLQRILSAVLAWYVAEAEDDPASTDEDLEDLEHARISVRDSSLPSRIRRPGPLPGDTWSGPDPEWEENLALVAGEDRPSDRIGVCTDLIDWSQNVHGLFDASGEVEWGAEVRAARQVVEVCVPGLDPQGQEAEEPVARVYLDDLPLPFLVPLSRVEGTVVFLGTRDMPAGRVTMVDVISARSYGPPADGAERLALREEQGAATAWAGFRLSEAGTRARGLSIEPELLLARPGAEDSPWLAEVVAAQPEMLPADLR